MMVKLFAKIHHGVPFTIVLVMIIMQTSCDFHVVKKVGSQISSSAERSKEVGTFVAKYRIDSSDNGYASTINFKSIFIEKKYSSDGGLFSGYIISAEEMQIVFRSINYLSDYQLQYGKEWELKGFKNPYSNCLYKSVSADFISDTLILKYTVKGDSVEMQNDLLLYRIE